MWFHVKRDRNVKAGYTFRGTGAGQERAQPAPADQVVI